jgi:AcrR family transcriptional regulator
VSDPGPSPDAGTGTGTGAGTDSDVEPSRPRRQARGERRIAQLLDAAASVFAEAGYEATTTNAIAARAGVSPGTLYQFFANKAAIAEALGTRYASQMRAAQAKILAGQETAAPASELVGHTIDVLITVNLDQPGAAALFDGESDDPGLRDAPAHHLHAVATERLDALLAARTPDLPAADRDRCVRVCICIYKAMLPVIGAAEGAERAGFVAELKAVLTRYLAPYLSISADAPRSL